MKKPAPPASDPTLAALKLSPTEVKMLMEKHLCGPEHTVQKEVLQLVRLSHPDGWSTLLGFVRVTPALATRWLKVNFGNRPVSDDTVTAYARDAVAGLFLTTHQGIAFNDKDELIDGQHRLLAIQKSGIACVLMVSFGWISEIKGKAMKRMDVIDRGRARSVSDQLKIQHGLKHGAIIAQIATQIANLCCPERTRRLSVGQTLEIYRAFQRDVDWVIERRSNAPGLKSAGVRAAFVFALSTCADAPTSRSNAVAALLEALNSGDTPAGTAIAHLYEFLTGEDAVLMQRSADRGLAELTLNAILRQTAGVPVARAHDLLFFPLEGADHYRALQKERADKIAAMFRLPAAQPSALNPQPKSK